MEPIRLLIAEDDPITSEMLTRLLSMEEGIEVVGAASTGKEALWLAGQNHPDVLLTDINMPGMNGIELTQAIKRNHPRTGVVVLTIYHDDEHVFDALKAGATGYVLKDGPIEETVAAVTAIARGDGLLHPAIAARVLAEFGKLSAKKAESAELFSHLSDREIEVLKELGSGKRNREIADALFIAEKTVKNHISNILFKLHVNDRTEAALLAARGGLV